MPASLQDVHSRLPFIGRCGSAFTLVQSLQEWLARECLDIVCSVIMCRSRTSSSRTAIPDGYTSAPPLTSKAFSPTVFQKDFGLYFVDSKPRHLFRRRHGWSFVVRNAHCKYAWGPDFWRLSQPGLSWFRFSTALLQSVLTSTTKLVSQRMRSLR